jgi:catechol 2,3-dioxygenase-like lactoylglutathione lyase family enzyme
MKLNHLLVPATHKVEAADFFAEIMGLQRGSVGHFAPVRINESLVLDFADINDVDLWKDEQGHFARQHYAFEVSDEEFDAAFGRIQEKGLRYGSGPGPRLYDMQINTTRARGGRAVYFDDLSGHSIELLTERP